MTIEKISKNYDSKITDWLNFYQKKNAPNYKLIEQ